MKSITYVSLGLVLIALFLVPSTANSQNTEKTLLIFEGSWQEALALAREENKPIFLAVTASWCGPCKRLKSNTFTDENVADYYNQTFINLVVDGEQGEGISLVRKYQVKAYPGLLYIHPDGSIISHEKGYHNPKSFLKLGKSIGAANLP